MSRVTRRASQLDDELVEVDRQAGPDLRVRPPPWSMEHLRELFLRYRRRAAQPSGGIPGFWRSHRAHGPVSLQRRAEDGEQVGLGIGDAVEAGGQAGGGERDAEVA
jgi:hypothetical protein